MNTRVPGEQNITAFWVVIGLMVVVPRRDARRVPPPRLAVAAEPRDPESDAGRSRGALRAPATAPQRRVG
jgi:hypothetical protein